jgi:excisionase family DNA binding protein
MTASPASDEPTITLSIDDVCRELGGISRPSFYRLLEAGLPSVRLGRRRVVLRSDLIAWLEARREVAA